MTSELPDNIQEIFDALEGIGLDPFDTIETIIAHEPTVYMPKQADDECKRMGWDVPKEDKVSTVNKMMRDNKGKAYVPWWRRYKEWQATLKH